MSITCGINARENQDEIPVSQTNPCSQVMLFYAPFLGPVTWRVHMNFSFLLKNQGDRKGVRYSDICLASETESALVTKDHTEPQGREAAVLEQRHHFLEGEGGISPKIPLLAHSKGNKSH